MKLAEWLKQNNVKQHAFGERIGLTQARVSQICAAGTDSLRVIEKIIEATEGAVLIEDLRQPPEAAE